MFVCEGGGLRFRAQGQDLLGQDLLGLARLALNEPDDPDGRYWKICCDETQASKALKHVVRRSWLEPRLLLHTNSCAVSWNACEVCLLGTLNPKP